MTAPIDAREVPEEDRWPLLVEARELFGPVAAAELAEAMGVVQRGEVSEAT